MMGRPKISFVCVFVATGFFAAHAQESEVGQVPSAGLSSTVEEILWWLPSDTETVIVCQQPFTPQFTPLTPTRTFTEILQSLSLGGLESIGDGELAPVLASQEILLALQGSRNFRPPTGLGSMLFEGCSVLVLGERASLELGKMPDRAVRIRVEGHTAHMFEERLEEDTWELFVTAPRPNLLLCATDRGYLEEVLRRMSERGEMRALPEELPEWRHLDGASPLWAVRHHDRERAAEDPTSPLSPRSHVPPDSQAVGVVFSFAPAKSPEASVKHLTANENAEAMIRLQWDSPSQEITPPSLAGGAAPTVRTLEPGVVEVRMDVTEREAAHRFLFGLLLVLGHSIYV